MFRFLPKKQNPPAFQKKLAAMVPANEPNEELTTDLGQNEQMLRRIFQNCYDVVFHSFRLQGDIQILIVYVSGLMDYKHLDEVFLRPIIFHGMPKHMDEFGKVLEEQLIAVGRTKVTKNVGDIVKQVLSGNVAILGDGDNKALLAGIVGWEKRGIEEPASEPVVRGPREGFIENILTNISMIRRRLQTPRLKTEIFTIGELSQTEVVIAYIEGVARESIVEEVRKRVGRIQVDGILESAYIEEFIEDSPSSPFPQIINTERPDVVAGQLLEGRVAILVDGTPNTLIVPVSFWSAMQTSEDYYERFLVASLIRWLRYLYLIIALFFPSLYVAITTYHQEMIPTSLLLTITAARERSPFPALIEALMMEVTFEALREAGLRLPKPIGQTLSIVGVLVIGEAAVSAGIVSAPMVIIVALTGIASFTIPRYNFGFAIRLLRFPIILLAGTFGLYGVALACMTILFHITSLRSFGLPYFSPVAPLIPDELKDVVIRAPWYKMILRPQFVSSKNLKRVPPGQKPGSKQGK
ncbi:spore germination protein [Paenibacillus filicis]|uniref:Spore germination protein n=1 Tax=Paenibacillus gyeongsangnamensis TaxID=3388067 RepID=A0ABT4Q3Q3_9BACL|nr:spore germination protein [Paenibacillus filicis]MCZ8511508.1 spore germination protein [Paenibacillus filicis]